MNHNQKGFAHLTAIMLVLLVVAVAVFSGVAVYNSNKKSSQSNLTSGPSTSNDQQAEDKTPTDVSTAEPVQNRPAPTPTKFSFTKGGSDIDGDVLNVSATSTDSHTGTCTYTFTLGNSKVQKSNAINNSRTCAISIPLSAFPKNGDWYFALNFSSKDGMFIGVGAGYTITVMPEERVINFVSGGGSQQGSVVAVTGNMSEAQTGTCTYKFSLNGTVRVTKTTTISNTKTCSASIPVSDFPKSAVYSFSLSFLSSNGLVTANQDPYNITVQ